MRPFAPVPAIFGDTAQGLPCESGQSVVYVPFRLTSECRYTDIVQGPDVGGERDARLLLIGSYDTGGSVTFVLDLLVTDDVVGEVHQMLHEIEAFGKSHERCTETDVPLNVSWLPVSFVLIYPIEKTPVL